MQVVPEPGECCQLKSSCLESLVISQGLFRLNDGSRMEFVHVRTGKVSPSPFFVLELKYAQTNG